MKKIFFKSTIPFFVTFISSISMAGDWQWGCVGKSQGNLFRFNRNALVVMTDINKSNLKDVTSDSIETYTAVDVNGGFDKQMVFTNSFGKMTLKEVSSKKTYENTEKVDCTEDRYREITNTTYSKVYEINGNPSYKINLDCYEYTVSTCG